MGLRNPYGVGRLLHPGPWMGINLYATSGGKIAV